MAKNDKTRKENIGGTARRVRWMKSSKSRAVSGFDRRLGSPGIAAF